MDVFGLNAKRWIILHTHMITGFGVDMTTTPIIITKDQLLENYGFFSKL